MTELQKTIAIDFTIAFDSLTSGILSDYKKPDRETFLKAAEIFYDNAKDLETIAFALRHGAVYVMSHDPEKFISAMRNPAVPQYAVDALQKQLEESRKPLRKILPKSPRQTTIYLMRNNRNGFIKIGQSDKPKHREKTLQSDEPEIELLKFWNGIAGQEKELHKRFSHLRLRGEWFKLSSDDIARIESIMTSKQGTEVASVR